MNAIRKIEDVKSGTITIDLPAEFHTKKVEIVISPVHETEDEGQSLRDFLLQAPVITDNELKEYQTVKEWMNKWSAIEF